MPDLTCVVVHWNVPDLLADCLASLRREVVSLRDQGVEAEIVVVDNASTAATRAAIRAAATPDVRYLWQAENEGYPRAANSGIAATATSG